MIDLRAGTPHVACPIHKKTFALESGDCLSDPGAYHVLTFRAKAIDDRVFVELPSPQDLDEVLETSKTEIHNGGCGGACGEEVHKW